MSGPDKIVLTGFMGVGKSSVSRHLSQLLKCSRLDLDTYIEHKEGRKIAQIIDAEGVARFREIESARLGSAIESSDARILSLGGGAFTIAENRDLLRSKGFTAIWLESTFEHCWINISFSKKERPLARDKTAALALFEERQKVYCLADWHFVIRPGLTSFDVARDIVEQVFA